MISTVKLPWIFCISTIAVHAELLTVGAFGALDVTYGKYILGIFKGLGGIVNGTWPIFIFFIIYITYIVVSIDNWRPRVSPADQALVYRTPRLIGRMILHTMQTQTASCDWTHIWYMRAFFYDKLSCTQRVNSGDTVPVLCAAYAAAQRCHRAPLLSDLCAQIPLLLSFGSRSMKKRESFFESLLDIDFVTELFYQFLFNV